MANPLMFPLKQLEALAERMRANPMDDSLVAELVGVTRHHARNELFTTRFGPYHRTLLHEAAETGCTKVLQHLFELKPSSNELNALDAQEQTPFELLVLSTGSPDENDEGRQVAFIWFTEQGASFGPRFEHHAGKDMEHMYEGFYDDWSRLYPELIKYKSRTDTRPPFQVLISAFESFARGERDLFTPGIFYNETQYHHQVSQVSEERLHMDVEDEKLGENAANDLKRDWQERYLTMDHLQAIVEAKDTDFQKTSKQLAEFLKRLETHAQNKNGDLWDETIIELYTSSNPALYLILNAHLNCQLRCSRLYSWGKSLQYALFRIGTKQPETVFKDDFVYRGMMLSRAQFESYKRREKTVRSIRWRSFSSATKSRKVAESFGNAIFVIDVKQPSDRPFLEHYKIIDISKLSNYKFEAEILIQAGTCFTIESAKEIGGDRYEINVKVKYPVSATAITVNCDNDLQLMRGYGSIGRVSDTQLSGVMLAPPPGVSLTVSTGGNHRDDEEKEKPRRIALKPELLNDAVQSVTAVNVCIDQETFSGSQGDEALALHQDLFGVTEMAFAKDTLFDRRFFDKTTVAGENDGEPIVSRLVPIQNAFSHEMILNFEFDSPINLDCVSLVLPLRSACEKGEEGDERNNDSSGLELPDTCPRTVKIFPRCLHDLSDVERERGCYREIVREDLPPHLYGEESWLESQFFRLDIDIDRHHSFMGTDTIGVYLSTKTECQEGEREGYGEEDFSSDSDEDEDEICAVYKVELWGQKRDQKLISAGALRKK